MNVNPSVAPDDLRLRVTGGGVTDAWSVPVVEAILLDTKGMLAEPVPGTAVEFVDCVEDGPVPTGLVPTPKVVDAMPLELVRV